MGTFTRLQLCKGGREREREKRGTDRDTTKSLTPPTALGTALK